MSCLRSDRVQYGQQLSYFAVLGSCRRAAVEQFKVQQDTVQVYAVQRYGVRPGHSLALPC